MTSNGECVNATTNLFQDREVLLYADANTEAATRLIWATASNRLDAIRVLLEAGANRT